MKIQVEYKIRQIRLSRHLTLDRLSALSGVSVTEINDIERGIREATVPTICMIAVALEVEVCDLFIYFPA